MEKIYLSNVASTNSWVLEALAKGEDLADETLVYTYRQTSGRGQIGNVWESEPDKNVAFSLLLKPAFLPVSRQFCISELCCLGVLDGLSRFVDEHPIGASLKEQIAVKWPNDIYVGDEKLGGILIENRLMGSRFSDCVLGVGLNVNQTVWVGGAPNPTSLRRIGFDLTPEQVLDAVTEAIVARYRLLKESPDEYGALIHSEYKNKLYRRLGYHPYVDAQTGEPFDAAIEDIEATGPLMLRLEGGERRSYWFKEVKFVLPCGITKE